jgi:hypothetical protein
MEMMVWNAQGIFEQVPIVHQKALQVQSEQWIVN